MRLTMRVLWILCLAAMMSGSALAQAVATAELHVSVKDPSGGVVTNATVAVRDESRAFERMVKAAVEGEYQFVLLPPGSYTVTVEAPGFARLVAKDVKVTVGQAAELPVALKVAGQASEVTVSAEAEMVETQRTSASTTIDQTRIDNLPINGRNYVNFTLTNSQVARDTAPSIGAAPTSGLNIGGQRARSNLVNVDGADTVDNSTNGIRSTVSQEAVQEFQLITNGYAAEYGRASGGVVNIITRSGSNTFHGTAFGYLRNRNFQAVNPFSNVPDPAYTRVQAGFTLGGALKKDKTFYFLSYETTRRQETGFSTIGGSDGNFGLVPFNTATDMVFPLPFGTILVTPTQRDFLAGLTLADLANPAFSPTNIGAYVATVGRASGVALNGSWPALLGGLAQFPSSCAPPLITLCAGLPASFVRLSSLIGNFPVSEGTSVVALRLDHRFNNNHQGMLRVNVSPSTVTGIQVNAQGPQNFGQNAFSRTSEQTFRDVNVTAQHTWTIGSNKVNEFRFQYARRGLLYDFSHAPGGSNVAVNLPGVAFLGREPFSFVRRTEQRYQFTNHLSWIHGNHNVKFGGDFNYVPLEADFTVNFGGVYNFGSTAAALLTASTCPIPGAPCFLGTPTRPFPQFSTAQSYGLGLPSVLVQGVGNPHDQFSNKTLGVFFQDTWRIRPNLTLNYGVRYDVEFTPEFINNKPVADTAFAALGLTQGIPRDTNNVAPRIGIAWDPKKNGKMVVRGSYGIFYDHPLLALAFDSDVADGTQAPQLALPPGLPNGRCLTDLNAVNAFQGIVGINPVDPCPPGVNFLNSEQRFLALNPPNSIFVNQNFLGTVPLGLLPFGFPVSKNFQYAYSHQASLGIERDLGHNFSLALTYNFNGGHHLNRPMNLNAVHSDLLVANWERAMADPALPASAKAFFANNPAAVNVCGVIAAGPLAGQAYIPAALANFFRPSGLNPALAPFVPAACVNFVAIPLLTAEGLGTGTPPIPFADMPANYSNGSSVYHGLTANLRKRFSNHYEFLASYTWSHAIDDSVDLQSPLDPQNDYNLKAERSTSLFDQRHRFVFSGVYQSGKLSGEGFWSKFFSDWTLAPIIEVSSGRPFNIITGGLDQNLDFSALTDRPMAVPSGTAPNLCGAPAVPSRFSPTGFFQTTCFKDGTFDGVLSVPLSGNLGRNAGIRPTTVFTDLRVARRFRLTERLSLDGMVDAFNLINRFNVADVSPVFANAGQPTAAFDPRQFQFALKLSW